MASVAIHETLPSALVACTVTRDVQEFEFLIDEMENEFGESWGDVSFEDALLFLGQDDSDNVQFMVVAVNSADEGDVERICAIVAAGKGKGIKVILLADEIGPIALHKFMRSGADDFLPYPPPDQALQDAIDRLSAKPVEPAAPVPMAQAAPTPVARAPSDRNGVVLPVHGLSGGVGATTFAVNLAVEMAALAAKDGQRVCLLDFDFQFGNVATYLDLPRREAVMDLLAEAAVADDAIFLAAMQTYRDGLNVLTSPVDMMPLEIVTALDIGHLIDMAQANFDYVIIDMPTTIVSWTEAVLSRAHVYFGLLELDLRNAQNILRLVRALKAEGLPHEKLRFALNRAPRFTDLSAKSRVKRMAESLDISLELQLSDGTAAVTHANDQGLPLVESAPKNPLRKDIMKLAQSLFELNASTAAATAKRRA
jgi:pilus assembly protein CpaE